MKISILEQGILSDSMSGGAVMQNAIKIAKAADHLGFHRLWHSEHHNMAILQGSSPEILLSAIGAQTTRIRLGTGGVMIGNHSPYHVAENFRTLEALYPGRVDCGIGRASGGDSYSASLLSTQPSGEQDFNSQVEALDIFLHDECKRARAMPLVTTAPPIWLLSGASHPQSGSFAAEKGLGFVIGLFINPHGNPKSSTEYRKAFRPSPDFEKPQVILAMNCVCSEDPDKLKEMKKTSDFFRLMRDSGNYPQYLPSPDKLNDFKIGEREQAYLEQISNREVTGTPEQIKKQVVERAERYGADEVMLTSMAYRLDDKLESFKALSKVFDLKID